MPDPSKAIPLADSAQEREEEQQEVVPVVVEDTVFAVHQEHHDGGEIRDPILRQKIRHVKNFSEAILYTLIGTSITHPLYIRQLQEVLAKSRSNKESVPWNKGLSLAVGSNLVKNMGFFFGMPYLQRPFQRLLPDYNVENLVFSAASILENILWAPVSYFRQQRTMLKTTNVFDVWKIVPHEDMFKGIKKGAFWGGVQSTLFAPAYITLCSRGEEKFVNHTDSDGMKALKKGMLGAIAGTCLSFLSYPANWVQRQVMQNPRVSTYELVRSTVKLEGPLGFYKGFKYIPASMGLSFGALRLTFFFGEKLSHQMHRNPEFIKRLAAPVSDDEIDEREMGMKDAMNVFTN